MASHPKYALALAEELLLLGDVKQAFKTLKKITSRKRDWSKDLELLMLKFVELSIGLDKVKDAKDALSIYRYVCQLQHSLSLDTVMRRFIQLAEDRTAEKRRIADEIYQSEVQNSPENSDEIRARVDREFVIPALKCQWETYRSVLDILKYNSPLDQLYKEVSDRAFDFCVENDRAQEFKKLTSTLRSHFKSLVKYGDEDYFEDPENVDLQLSIRFKQAETASRLNLWQDCFRSAEDINIVLKLSKNLPTVEHYAEYYKHLTEIFWHGKNYFLHARALLRLLDISRKFYDFSDEDEELLSSKTLIAALIVVDRTDTNVEATNYLTMMFDFNFKRGRQELFQDIKKLRVIESTYDEIQVFYKQSEVDFDPFELPNQLTRLLEFLESNDELARYCDAMRDMGVNTVVGKFSKIYKNVKIDTLQSLFSFLDVEELERHILDAQKKKILQCTINHRLGIIIFNSSPYEEQNLRSNLNTTYRQLQRVVQNFHPTDPLERIEEKKSMFLNIELNLHEEREKRQNRKALIARMKELREQEKKAEKERQRREQLEQIKRHQEEQARLKQKSLEEKRRLEAEKQENKKKLEKAQEFAKQLEGRKDIVVKADEIDEDVDPDAFIEETLRKLLAEKNKREKKINTLSQNMDYMIRAQRELERDLIAESWESIKSKERNHYELKRKEFFEQYEQEYKKGVELKERFLPVAPSIDDYTKNIEETVNEIVKEREEKRREKIAKYLAERMPQYEAERAEAEAKRKKEEEERAEAERKRQEERERIEAERRSRMGDLSRPKQTIPGSADSSKDWRKDRPAIRERPSRPTDELDWSRGKPARDIRTRDSRREPQREDAWKREQKSDIYQPPTQRERTQDVYKPRRDTWKREPQKEDTWKREQRSDTYQRPTQRDAPPQRDQESWRKEAQRKREQKSDVYQPPTQRDVPPQREPKGTGSWRTDNTQRDAPPPQRDQETYQPPRNRQTKEDTWKRGQQQSTRSNQPTRPPQGRQQQQRQRNRNDRW